MVQRKNSAKTGRSYGLWFEIQVALATATVWALGRSLRVSWHQLELVESARERTAGRGIIFACWHQRLLPFCFTHRRRSISVLVSTHRDGELIARVLGNLGNDTVRGSSTRGGREALRQMAAESRTPYDLWFTPDGPRGPARELKPGLLVLARRSGRPVIPIANAVWPRVELSSWDRLHIPLPFARCAIVHGDPWWPDREMDAESIRKELEARLNEVTRVADSLVGAKPLTSASE